MHNVAMYLVLTHMLVGCCWHHAHAEHVACCQEHSDAVFFHRHEDGDHDTGDHDCPHHDSPCHQNGCDEGECVFVVPEVDTTVKLIDGGHPLAIAPMEPFSGGSAKYPSASPEAPPPSNPPPLRLHLMNQVLLI